ncbi:hypothetical protein [Bacillus cereus group sp. N21]|uniref:hypothetical protein n=1 Tax=Bacillus cereus group sp. N21 TaxID=2794591 RepID=UPI0018F6C5E8|nr:hypothetical protein [Bacillus cereus group sp. N21]MBJ8030938.1 hypothetical protein [Bacillus cereus group sp. N21]
MKRKNLMILSIVSIITFLGAGYLTYSIGIEKKNSNKVYAESKQSSSKKQKEEHLNSENKKDTTSNSTEESVETPVEQQAYTLEEKENIKKSKEDSNDEVVKNFLYQLYTQDKLLPLAFSEAAIGKNISELSQQELQELSQKIYTTITKGKLITDGKIENIQRNENYDVYVVKFKLKTDTGSSEEVWELKIDKTGKIINEIN